MPLIEVRPAGLYCNAGDFYIDPWHPVERAVITHGHSDHARSGSRSYLCATPGKAILQTRLGPDASIEAIPYGQPRQIHSATLTLYPAGHVLGSAQVKIESAGEIWVISGDYKLDPDPTCDPFEPIRCHGFVTEATFALPIYHWAPAFSDINHWWQQNKLAGRTSVLYAYSLGKAQRLLASIDSTIGPIYTHGAVERINDVYRASGVSLPPTSPPPASIDPGALVIAPPATHGSPWLNRFGDYSSAVASGWMQLRGHRRRRAVDRGFVISDHADWPGLVQAIQQTEAQTIWVTHGYIDPLVRWLQGQGHNAAPLATQFSSDEDTASA